MTTPTATARDKTDSNGASGWMQPKQTRPRAMLAGDADTRAAFLRDRDILRRDINDTGIVRVPAGSRELPSMESENNFYEWQFYLRRILLKPAHLTFIARCFWSIYANRYRKQPFQLAGVEQASIPILTTLILTAQSVGIEPHAFTVRKERKAFGLRNIIEGEARTDLPVVYVDDLTSPSHATLWHFIRTLAEARLQIAPRGFVVVYKGLRETLREIPTSLGNLGIESIFTLDDFELTLANYISNKKRTGNDGDFRQ